ncbi:MULTISPECIES: hypothetical protein [Bacillus]|uniref:hypothetical protein n=1 Tax=Bacillus TaxID=1386 RepID=UPI0001A186F5|nr:hypothetical protein [Bacillus pseudomycoides]EEM13595.1 hypothetical protein bpmyx0001_55690 [Bacillus pseudomycoides DSM 12442]MED1599316.1 hypothetical protein [Bacillus pseudomycoides]MED4712989.1 hypothetical protein [Bacillus pseudomycoides]OOR48955.1 hypothetical protein BLX05_26695 [Bacillus pseudomycoides]PDY08226.1 hypothetical protein COO16_30295 [Bacillus pseudomycoides]
MNLQNKIEAEIQILKSLVERYKQSDEDNAASMVVAYEYGLQALIEVYEVSKQTELTLPSLKGQAG